MKQEYEYFVGRCGYASGNIAPVKEYINEMNKQGWRLVAAEVVHLEGRVLYFERKIKKKVKPKTGSS